MTELDLATLRPGDIVRDSRGVRIRVQKILSNGLRIHDQRRGARNTTFEELMLMGLTIEEKPSEGRTQAPRRLGELRAEAERLGVDLEGRSTMKEIETAIGMHLVSAEDSVLDQIDPMLASDDPKKLQDFGAAKPWRSTALHKNFWDNDEWVAEEKLDGVRLKLHFTSVGVRVDSRRRDTVTRRFSEKSPNFPHLLALRVSELEGTVLDAEGMILADSGVLPSGVRFHGRLSPSVAATNSSPEVSLEIQNLFGPMKFFVFDVLRYRGHDVTKAPYSQRREMLSSILELLYSKIPPIEPYIEETQVAFGSDKLVLFERLLAEGGEGVIFKRISAPYEQGKRSRSWQKLKKFQEVDAFVSGFVPGKGGNEGLVGALELSVKIDGAPVGVAACSQLTGVQRLEMTAPDGSLKPEYYDRVVTFRGQEMTKNGRFRHAIIVGFREDKTCDDCDGYEIREELLSLRPELVVQSQGASSTQDSFL